jgi:hypothetical protein
MEENKTGIFKLPVLFHFYNAGETILDFMIERGSIHGYLLRESIL